MLTLRSSFIATLAIIVLAGLCACHPYVLPTPDGGGPAPSPPSLMGQITAVLPGEITVSTQGPNPSATNSHRVELMASTSIFSEDGGYVPVERLRAGQSVSIWFVKNGRSKKGTPPLAASIMIHPPGL